MGFCLKCQRNLKNRDLLEILFDIIKTSLNFRRIYAVIIFLNIMHFSRLFIVAVKNSLNLFPSLVKTKK